MKIKILRVLKVVVFCVLALAMIWYITQLFTPKWLENRWASAKTNKTFYDLEDNSVDVGFYGSSVVAASVDPYQLYKEQGISAYNFGVMSQDMMGTYFWVKESLRSQTPKVVCIEVKSAGRKTDKDENKARKSYDYMEWSFNKLKYAYENHHTFPESDIYEYLFPIMKYHDRWRELSYDDYDFMAGNYKSYTRGMATLTTYCKDTAPDYADFSGIKLDDTKIGSGYNDTNDAYLRRIIGECQAKGIQVLLFKAPDPRWTPYKHNHILSAIKKFDNVEFLDLSTSEWFEENNYVYATDGCDSMHVNLKGAKKITAYLGNYLTEHYDLKDYRKDSKISKKFNEELKMYEDTYEDAMICFETNPTAYLKQLKQDRYTILISAGKDLTGHFSKDEIKALKSLGLDDSFFDQKESKYNTIAVLDKTKAYYKHSQITEEAPLIKNEDTLRSGIVYKIVSGKNASEITVAETNYAVKSDALNLVVYDNETNAVADSIAFSLDTKGNIVLKR